MELRQTTSRTTMQYGRREIAGNCGHLVSSSGKQGEARAKLNLTCCACSPLDDTVLLFLTSLGNIFQLITREYQSVHVLLSNKVLINKKCE